MAQDIGDPILRKPINVTSRHPDERIRLISNFSETPFELDGTEYCSVESFWQGLKFESTTDRIRLARLVGAEAMKAARGTPYAETLTYRGVAVRVGSCSLGS